jgi:hypothetical protein
VVGSSRSSRPFSNRARRPLTGLLYGVPGLAPKHLSYSPEPVNSPEPWDNLVPTRARLVHISNLLISSDLRSDPNPRVEPVADLRPGRLLKIEGDDGIVVLVSARRTRAGNPVLRKGPFKGKRVELASTTGIQTFDEIAEDFMLTLFGFDPGQYLITDLSSLHDFVGVDDMEIGDMLTRIREVYGLDVADLPNGNLLEIFRRLHEHQAGGRRSGLAQ